MQALNTPRSLSATSPLNHCYKTPRMCRHTVWEGINLPWPPLPGKALKLFFFSFPPNSVSRLLSTLHLWTEAAFQQQCLGPQRLQAKRLSRLLQRNLKTSPNPLWMSEPPVTGFSSLSNDPGQNSAKITESSPVTCFPDQNMSLLQNCCSKSFSWEILSPISLGERCWLTRGEAAEQ